MLPSSDKPPFSTKLVRKLLRLAAETLWANLILYHGICNPYKVVLFHPQCQHLPSFSAQIWIWIDFFHQRLICLLPLIVINNSDYSRKLETQKVLTGTKTYRIAISNPSQECCVEQKRVTTFFDQTLIKFIENILQRGSFFLFRLYKHFLRWSRFYIEVSQIL